METVTVSTRYRIMIPRAVWEPLDLRPGQRLQVIAYENRIELIPLRPVQASRGFLKGIDTTVDRRSCELSL